jgi:glycosyltransferase involved in cell wall biosynthesis
MPGFIISVGIVTYKRPFFLKQAVQSVLQQKYKDFELIISNDDPDSKLSFESIGIKKDSRIKIINQRSNLGEIDNLNFVLKKSKGDWFVWLGDDDLMHPDFLSLGLRRLANFSNRDDSKIVAYYSDYYKSNNLNFVFSKLKNNPRILYLRFKNFLDLYSSNKINLIGTYGLLHRKTLIKIGGILRLGSQFCPYSDTLIPILLAKEGVICWEDSPLILLRTHSNSLSIKSHSFIAYISAEKDFISHLYSLNLQNYSASYSNKIYSNFIQWFAINEWAVLDRNPNFSYLQKVRLFFLHQVKSNFPKLSFKHKCSLSIFLFSYLSYKAFSGIFSCKQVDS